MTPEQFAQHFEIIAEAPGGVKKLREMILDLAVRGKLVTQDTDIALTSYRAQGMPFAIPSHWRCVRVDELTSKLGAGSTPLGGKSVYQLHGIKFIRSQNVWNDGLRLDDIALIPSTIHQEMSGTIVKPGDILLNITGASIGRSALVDDDFDEANVSQHVAIVRLKSLEHRRFVHLCIISPYFQHEISRVQVGVSREGLSMSRLRELLIPLPPLAEQKRIVARVDELMALCDELERIQLEKTTVKSQLRKAALDALSRAEGEDETQASFARVVAQFDALFDSPESVGELRQAILDLAVRGKLVRQEPGDEPASELLRNIAAERAKLLRSGYPNPDEARAQTKKLAVQCIPASALGSLPVGWTWATLMQCCALVVDCKNKTAPYSTTGIRLIRTTNVRNGKLNSIDQKYVDNKTYESWSARCRPESGDILITREAPVGEVCIVPPGEVICLGQRMMLARLIPNTIHPSFMLYSLRDPKLMDRVQDKPIGATVQHLRVGGVETLLVPLPPLAEQKRIVARVDELMALCDELEAQLGRVRETAGKLVEAVASELAVGSAA